MRHLSTEPGPTPPLLLYFYADKIISTGNITDWRTVIPCKDVKVKGLDLATLLFASSFWHLREQGLLQLEVLATKRLLVVRDTIVRVRLLEAGERSGLEGAIVSLLSAEQEMAVIDLIVRWIGKTVPRPDELVVQGVQEEAVALGYMDEVDAERGRAAGKLMGKTRREPNCHMIATLEHDAEVAIARIEQFKTAEPNVYGALSADCKRGIGLRTTRSD